ncbi:MAG: DNA methyltransferase [Phototrophicales bacterium]|nr:DNA methyltransferase [Phototrophicales bacterium]
MLLTKAQIEAFKTTNLNRVYEAIRSAKSARDSVHLLENLGHLPDGFDGQVLLSLIEHDNSDVRALAIKNLGKLTDMAYLEPFHQSAIHDTDSLVRREAVSAIGRMRDARCVPMLLSFCDDPDPKIVLQAVRGLVIFKSQSAVMTKLQTLCNHPNETVSAFVSKELGQSTTKTTIPHSLSPEWMHNLAIFGDVQQTLPHIPDEAVHLTFTSPPYYNARDYSIYPSYTAYLDFLTDIFAQTHRITKEGRFLVVNTSPVIVPRVSRAHASVRYPIPFDLHTRLVGIGWEFVDDIVWVKPEASVKNRNGGFLQHRKPLGYKPNTITEYLMVYRKKTDKLIDWNMRQYDEQVINESKITGDYETSNVWHIDPTFDKVHSAVFPAELCRRVIGFYSYMGDLVFDPFGGSGTLGKVAMGMGRNFFLTEQDPTYFERIRDVLADTFFVKNRFMTLDEMANMLKELSE